MARPFREDVNIQPQGISTGQPQALMSLSQKLDNFAAQQAQVAAQRTIEAATIKGRQAGVEQQKTGEDLTLKKETYIGGIAKKAFNQAAREGYLKSLDNDIITSFSALAAQYPDNLQAYNTEAQAMSKGFIAHADPMSRPAVELSIDSLVSRHRPKIQAQQAKNVMDEANNEAAINATARGREAQSAAYEGDTISAGENLALAIDSVANRTDLSESQQSVAIRELQLQERQAFYSGELSRSYTDEGAEATMDKLAAMDGQPPQGFTPDEWERFISKESKNLNRRMAREKKQSAEDIKAAKLAASIKRGELLTNPDSPADPAGSSDNRKDLNNYYAVIAETWQGLSLQEQVDKNVEFITNSGLIPDRLISGINATMRSGNTEQIELISDLIARVQDNSPRSLADIPSEARAISSQIIDARRAGMDMEAATEAAVKNAYYLTDTEQDTIKLRSKEVAKDLEGALQSRANKDVNDGGFDTGWLSFVPDVPDVMLGDFRNSFERFMVMTGGDTTQSESLAYEATRSVWGVTETGGEKRFMKFAPEVMYAVPNSNMNWVEEQFNEEMEAIGAEGAMLGIDRDTAREAQPSYPVQVLDDNGRLQPLRGDYQENLTWRPDYSLTEEYQAIADAPVPVDKMETAKAKRARYLERRAAVIRRGIQSRVLSAVALPINERADYLASDEGRVHIERAINNMVAGGRLDPVEAKEAKRAFDL